MSGNDELLKLLEASGDEEAILDFRILKEELEGKALEEAIRRRALGEPLAYILGYRHFYKECYKVEPGVLIPRADTETVVESALKFLGINPMATGDLLNVPSYDAGLADIVFADLCTGSGCIGISIANEICRNKGIVKGYLVDISDVALRISKANVQSQAICPDALSVVECDILHGFPKLEKLDFIVTNPPYITNSEMEDLDSVVKDYEPDLALRAGDDGLDFYGPIARNAMTALKDGGAIFAEHGYEQGEAVRAVFEQAGFKNVMTIRDYGGNPRVTLGIKKSQNA